MSGLSIRTLVGLGLMISLATTLQAQSSSRNAIPRGSSIGGSPIQGVPVMQGSSHRGQPVMQGSPVTQRQRAMQGSNSRVVNQGSTTRPAGAVVGLQGYCPVCIIKMKKWVKGNPNIQATYDGKTYYFPGEEQKQMFLASPTQFAPALGGDCAVCLTNMKQRMPGSVFHSALNNGRLYLFPSDKQKQMFVSDPGKYNHADVAMNGNCVVCRVEMNKDVPGDPAISLLHGGMKYQFASDEQRNMFNANPAKYTASVQP